MSQRKLRDQYLGRTRGLRATLTRELKTAAKQAGNAEIRRILLHALYPRKYLCAMMAVGAYEAAGGQDGQVAGDIAVFTEAVNLGWMLADDIVDDHCVRFGKPTAKSVFGEGKTIIAALHLMSYGYARIGEYRCKSLTRLAETYSGWLDRDLRTEKSVADCKAALQNLGSCYGAFSRIASEIAGGRRQVQETIERFGQQTGYALAIMGECFDLKGQPGRPIAEEFRRGTNVYLVRKAEAKSIHLAKPQDVWMLLHGSRAHGEVIEEISACLANAQQTLTCLGWSTAILASLLETIRSDLTALQ